MLSWSWIVLCWQTPPANTGEDVIAKMDSPFKHGNRRTVVLKCPDSVQHKYCEVQENQKNSESQYASEQILQEIRRVLCGSRLGPS